MANAAARIMVRNIAECHVQHERPPAISTRVTLGAGSEPEPAGPSGLICDRRADGDLAAVPATTTVELFGGTDGASVWQDTRATRAWDRSYLPARNRGGFPIEADDLLWGVTPRAQTDGGSPVDPVGP